MVNGLTSERVNAFTRSRANSQTIKGCPYEALQIYLIFFNIEATRNNKIITIAMSAIHSI